MTQSPENPALQGSAEPGPGPALRAARLLVQVAVHGGLNRAAARAAHAHAIQALDGDEAVAAAAEFDAERDRAEQRFRELDELDGLTLSREELARTYGDVVAWSPESPPARRLGQRLRSHLQIRFGVIVHGTETSFDPGQDHDRLQEAIERTLRLRTALAVDVHVRTYLRDHHPPDDIPQTELLALYGPLQQWEQECHEHGNEPDSMAEARERLRQALSLPAANLGDIDLARVLFIIDYLTGSSEATTFDTGPLVPSGELVKRRVDELLIRYQQRLNHTASLTRVAQALDTDLAPLSAHDRAEAIRRRTEIEQQPHQQYLPLWPGQVDRAELADELRFYAEDLDRAEHDIDDQATGALAQATLERLWMQRRALDRIIDLHPGLTDLERDRLRLTLAGLDAGRNTLPPLLFADDRSSRTRDAQRRIAAGFALGRRVVEEFTEAVGNRKAVRAVRGELDTVRDTLARIATNTPRNETDLDIEEHRFGHAVASIADDLTTLGGAARHNRDDALTRLMDGGRAAATAMKATQSIESAWEKRIARWTGKPIDAGTLGIDSVAGILRRRPGPAHSPHGIELDFPLALDQALGNPTSPTRPGPATTALDHAPDIGPGAGK